MPTTNATAHATITSVLITRRRVTLESGERYQATNGTSGSNVTAFVLRGRRARSSPHRRPPITTARASGRCTGRVSGEAEGERQDFVAALDVRHDLDMQGMNDEQQRGEQCEERVKPDEDEAHEGIDQNAGQTYRMLNACPAAGVPPKRWPQSRGALEELAGTRSCTDADPLGEDLGQPAHALLSVFVGSDDELVVPRIIKPCGLRVLQHCRREHHGGQTRETTGASRSALPCFHDRLHHSRASRADPHVERAGRGGESPWTRS